MPARRAVLAGVVAVVLLAAVSVAPASGRTDAGSPAAPNASPVPGVLGIDHFGITVPDVAEAAQWFEDVIGCTAPLSFGPFSDPAGSLMERLVGVHPRAEIERIVELRCGTGSNIELFQYAAPDQSTAFARNSDFGGHHVAFYVTDIAAAVAYMEAKDVQKLAGPLPVTDGPAAGQTINYFRTPFGLYVELISYPGGMAYEQTSATRLWNPADVGAAPHAGGLPGLLGVDHFGITVADVAKASRWLEDTLGCTTPLVFGPFSGVGPLVDVTDDAVIEQIRELRCGANGANLELFQYRAPGQDRTVPRNSDYAGNHVAFYVRDIAAAAAAMSGRGARPFLGPFPIAEGPAAGQSINYFLPPIQHYLELISYPDGMAYESGAATVLWSPRNPTG